MRHGVETQLVVTILVVDKVGVPHFAEQGRIWHTYPFFVTVRFLRTGWYFGRGRYPSTTNTGEGRAESISAWIWPSDA